MPGSARSDDGTYAVRWTRLCFLPLTVLLVGCGGSRATTVRSVWAGHAQKQAHGRGVKIAGCTVHFVDGGVDTGPIIAQAAVPVLEEDDAEALRARILAEEHRLLPAVVRAIAERRVIIEDRKVRVLAAAPSGEVLRSL